MLIPLLKSAITVPMPPNLLPAIADIPIAAGNPSALTIPVATCRKKRCVTV
jgi:hypothetical protein